MKTFYISFGQNHAHQVGDLLFTRDTICAIHAESAEGARQIASDTFGPKWSMLYEKEPNMAYFPLGVISLK